MNGFDNHIKERLNIAYMSAIVSHAGYTYEPKTQDYGIDGTINGIAYLKNKNRCASNGFNIDVQLKSSINIKINDNKVIYDLEVKNYNDLIEIEIGTPRILILYSMPKNKDDWLSINEEELILRKCAWWCSLKGNTPTQNKNKIRISIPDNQIFNPDTVKNLMARVMKGEEL